MESINFNDDNEIIPALEIRNLTPKFNYNDRNEMLYGLGATSVHNHPNYSIAFFPDEIKCHLIIRLLHQRKFNYDDDNQNRRLRVEFVKNSKQIERLPCHYICDQTLKCKIEQSKYNVLKELRKNNQHDNNQINLNLINDLDNNINIPKINDKIIENIQNYLLNNDKFYKLVILLMKQLNLNIDYQDDDLSEIPLPLSSDESEIESNNDLNDNKKFDQNEFNKLKNCRKRKKLKIGLIDNNNNNDDAQVAINEIKKIKQSSKTLITTEIDEIFDTTTTPSIIKKHSINLKTNINNLETIKNIQENNNDNVEEIESSKGFGLIESTTTTKKSKISTNNNDNFDIYLLRKEDLFTDNDIEKKLLNKNEWNNYKVFDNYNDGDKNQRLYVKNIHPKITLFDLYRLFGRYINLDNNEHLDKFNIIYMKKGRMHGQAFIIYPNIELATIALNSTNGYKFFDRPIVVQYGKIKQ